MPLRFAGSQPGCVSDDDGITFAGQVGNIRRFLRTAGTFPAFRKAGPRKKIFHDPAGRPIRCGRGGSAPVATPGTRFRRELPGAPASASRRGRRILFGTLDAGAERRLL